MATQTDLAIVERVYPIVSFLENSEAILEPLGIPNCYRFASSRQYVKSPKIPILIEGIRVPMVIDTGAEVSILPISVLRTVSPNQLLPNETREVRSLDGTLVPIKGPLQLRVQICNVTLLHSFYFIDQSQISLMGYDLISVASLVIDSEHRCVWSRMANPCVTSDNAAPFLEPEFVSTNAPCTLRGDAPPFQPSASQFRSVHESCSAITATPVTPFVFSRADTYAGPRADTSFRYLPHGNGRDSSANSDLVTFTSCESSSLFFPSLSESVVTKAEPCDIFHESTESLFTSPALNGDVVSSADTMVKTVEVPDTQMSESISATNSNQTDIELPEHINVLFLETVNECNLTSDVERDLKQLLYDHSDTFARSSTDLGFCNIIKHDIDTGDSRPIKQSPRRPPLAARDAEDEILNEMLETGVIEPSTSPWASPVCLVSKKDGTFRFCIDYRRVNAVSKKDAYPLPDIQDALDNLRGSNCFATIDLLSGYWQLGMTERAKERSAFCTRRGLFQFTRMPFGLSGAPGSFCRLMQIVLRDHLWTICLCYLDDIVVFAKTPQELLERLRTVLDRLRQVGLKVKPSKCDLFRTEIKFLGHMVSAYGIEPLPDKIETIQDWPTPKCLRDVRAFFGLASYYRRFVQGFATIAEPLTSLTKKHIHFDWNDEAQKAFNRLKQELINATSLAFPYPDRPCIVDTDASDVGLGAVLSQTIDGIERPIAFFSRVMNQAQRNYCATRRELLAVISALQHFRHYLLGNKVILRTDHHSLKWLKTFNKPEGILARWVETLAEFDIEIEHRPGRLHSNVDGVSRQHCKQCGAKPSKTRWVDELERANELVGPLGVHTLQIPQANMITLVPEFSDGDIAELQAEDPDIGPVFDWLISKQQPPDELVRSMSLETRNLWSQCPTITMSNGLLVRQKENHPIQLVVPECLRKQLFQMAHAGPLAAHLAGRRTFQQLAQAYYWPGMRKEVTSWCQQCPDCATCKGPPNKHKGHLQKVLTGAPLDIVAVDILSGVPVTPDGSKYILVLTDYFTKWACAFALPDAEASTCMRAMYDGFFSSFGFPRQIHTDLGKNFEGRLFHELCQLAGIKKTHTTPFHPQSDGQTERMNRTLLQMLRTTADENPYSWPQRLFTVMSAYRMTVHSVTGITPNMAMLGREVLLPVTLIVKPPDESSTLTVPFVTNLRDTLRDAHRRVREATQSVAKTQKTYYDRRTKLTRFAVDQLVWLYWPKPPVRMKFKKLQRLWTGPWKIIKFHSPLVVEIQELNKCRKQTVHIDRLTPCNLSPDQVVQSEIEINTDSHDIETEIPKFDSISTESEIQNTELNSQIVVSQRPIRTRRKPKALEPYVLI